MTVVKGAEVEGQAMEISAVLVRKITSPHRSTLRQKCCHVEINICILTAGSSEPPSISASPLSAL